MIPSSPPSGIAAAPRSVAAALVVLLGPLSLSAAPIWSVSDEDSTVYLAGSIHLLREKDLPVPGEFDAAYREAGEVVFEIDMRSLTLPSTGLEIRALGQLPDGEKLGDKLSEETMTLLRGYLAENKLPGKLFDRFTPGMAYLTLGTLEAARHGASPDLGLETLFYRKAVNDNKPTRGLETIQFQMSRFNELEAGTVESLIRETLEDTEESEEALDEIVAAWRSGDREKIETLIVDKMSSDDEVRRVLLVDRNRNWIPAIEEALAGKTNVLFLVGAAHLAGRGSVLELLEERGHKPVRFSATTEPRPTR